MNSENQKNFLESMENTIVLEARLIDLKRRKQAFDREIKEDMARIGAMINEEKNNWGCKLESQKDFSSPIKMDLEDFEKQQTNVDIMIDKWVEQEVEKEHKRWKKLTPEERMKEHLDIIETLREAEKNNWNCSK